MTDDLVERLRHCSQNTRDEYLHELTGRAADRITRQDAVIAGLVGALEGIFRAEKYDLHIGYDYCSSGGGNHVYADVIRLDDDAFRHARTALAKAKESRDV